MKLPRLLTLATLLAVFSSPLPAVYDGWMTDLDAAKAKAAKEGRKLLIDFTGSTWCPPCKALHAEVLTTPEFAAFSKDFVLVALDFPPMSGRTPEKIAADPALAKLMALKTAYGVPGFPTVLLYDASGKQLAKEVGYGGGPAAWLAKFAGK